MRLWAVESDDGIISPSTISHTRLEAETKRTALAKLHADKEVRELELGRLKVVEVAIVKTEDIVNFEP